jgi:hypothetical protein
MAVTISTQYRRASDNSIQDITVTVDLVTFRAQAEPRTSMERDVYLKVSANGTTSWYRQISGHVSDALRAYKLNIDGGTSVDSTSGGAPAISLDMYGTEGVLTQLEKLAAPTAVDATAMISSGEVYVVFKESVSSSALVAGYYFFYSADCIAWTRCSGQGGSGISTGCIAKADLGSATVGGVAMKTFTLTSIPSGIKYFGVSAVDSTSATTEFCESEIGLKVAAITVG